VVRTIRLPDRFKNWAEYEDAYGVDVIPEVWVMRCQVCGAQWPIRHNRGKMLRGAHVCPNECNGELKRRGGGQPPMLRRRLDALQDWRGRRDADRFWEEQQVRDDSWDDEARAVRMAEGRRRRAKAQLWLQLRANPEVWASLDRMFDAAAMQPDPMAYVQQECSRLRAVDRA